jgi:hypothetical protein
MLSPDQTKMRVEKRELHESFRVIPCHFNTGMTPTLSKFIYILQAVTLCGNSLSSKFERHSCNSF